MTRIVADVAVGNTFFSFDTDFTYLVENSDCSSVLPGTLVKVPFGNSDKLRSGIVIRTRSDSTDKKLKCIAEIGERILTDEAISLALWLKDRCFCTTFDCLKQMLPPGLGKISAKKQKMVCLTDDADNLKLTKKQQAVYDLLLETGEAEVKDLCRFCSVGFSVINTMEKHGVVRFFEKEIYRSPYSTEKSVLGDSEVLSSEQQKAYDALRSMLDGGGRGLLFGVTGSGKTKVYLRLIDDTIKSGKDVIVLVPEIGLTPQTMEIFQRRYGNTVAVLHSGLSLGERRDEFKRLDTGNAKIAVGTRSAVFAPLHNLGLIIIDEEQEHTYRSERTPRYNAKDVARYRAAYNKALLLLSSATPSIETYSAAVKGKYTLCTLGSRYGNSILPNVITVDMKKELKLGNRTPISHCLREKISETLDNKKQAILLINRRGYNTFVACTECGKVVTCPNCSISLTYHSKGNRLVCHYCGYSRHIDNICPDCGSPSLRYSGYGTQRIEDELKALFPEARILRMDADTTSTKSAHQKLFDSFSSGKYDILIGTQMVAKGLDFDNVTLVGVVNADNSLYDEDYSANEKTFDLITQVIGRAGRRDEPGTAVVQTINPSNETLGFAAEQDYVGFYNNEIQMRRIMIYPPYCDLLLVSFSGIDENSVSLAAKYFFEQLVSLNSDKFNDLKFVVLGPTPAKISKINNNYRYRLTLKCKNSTKIRTMLTEILKSISKIREYKDVSVSIDVNPGEIS